MADGRIQNRFFFRDMFSEIVKFTDCECASSAMAFRGGVNVIAWRCADYQSGGVAVLAA
jgi:hypothetical protein